MRFAPDIHLAAVDDRGVVLDLERDRYRGLGPDLTRAALLLTGRTCDAFDAGALSAARDHLVAQGILCDGPCDPPPPQPGLPDASLWPRSTAGAAGRRQLSALRVLGETAWRLRHRPYRSTVGWLRLEKRRLARRRRASPQLLLDAFWTARPWFPVRPICRLDAAALCLLFWRHGWDADLVFGVRLDRFGAHCWSQQGKVVVNDAHESVRQYTPIMCV